MSAHEDEIESLLQDVTARFPALPIDSLRRYVLEILQWNDEIGLVSKKSPLAACKRLLLESAEFESVIAGAVVAGPARVADVGSGAGFPGMVWRLLRAEWDIVLIERRERKAAFLEHAVRSLGLSNTEVVAADARDTSRLERFRGTFDLVATMAVGEPARTAPQIEDLLRAGGLFATTLPEEASAPERCGRRLVMEADTRAHFGRYGLYRNRV